MRTSTLPLTDRLMGGTLAQKLTEWRTAGDSMETIARRLENEHAIQVSSSTVGRWCDQLGVTIEPATDAPSAA